MRKLVLVGDKVLILPEDPEARTASGLYLPATVKEKELVQGGYVIQVGPGYLLPNPDYDDEPWAAYKSAVRYLPLQAQEGDYAFFLRKEAVELTYENQKYLIIPHHAILALIREQSDNELEYPEEE